MKISEYGEVKKYLFNLMKEEENSFKKSIEIFYNKYKIEFRSVYIQNFYDENFFLVLEYGNYGIYFNDIEESYGICKLHNNDCILYAEFFDNLSPTIQKLMNLIENNSLDQILST